MTNVPRIANIWTGKYKKIPSALLCYTVLFGFSLPNTNETNPLYQHQKVRLAKWCLFWQIIIGRCCCFVVVHLHQGEGWQKSVSRDQNCTRGKQPRTAPALSIWATPVLQHIPANWVKCLCSPSRGRPLSERWTDAQPGAIQQEHKHYENASSCHWHTWCVPPCTQLMAKWVRLLSFYFMTAAVVEDHRPWASPMCKPEVLGIHS